MPDINSDYVRHIANRVRRLEDKPPLEEYYQCVDLVNELSNVDLLEYFVEFLNEPKPEPISITDALFLIRSLANALPTKDPLRVIAEQVLEDNQP